MEDTVTPVAHQEWRDTGSTARETPTGLVIDRVEGTVYYPPVSPAARLPVDQVPARQETIGAAFAAVGDHRPDLGG